MNTKLAKLLRKKAKSLLGGFKPTEYTRNSNTGAVEVTLNCTRGVYREMKRAVKAGIR